MIPLYGLQPLNRKSLHRLQRIVIAIYSDHLAAPAENLLRVPSAPQRTINIYAAFPDVQGVNRLGQHDRNVPTHHTSPFLD